MKKILCFIIPAALVLIAGCTGDKPGPDTATISVNFFWDEKNFEVSPEVILGNVPEATSYFKVKMFDLSNRYPHGSARIEKTVTGRIPAGVLTPYESPAPYYGSSRYEITVKAYDSNDKLIGIGKKMRRYPEEP